MTPYIALFIFVFIISLYLGNYKMSENKICISVFIVLISSSLFAGLRNMGVGTDTEIYIRDYYNSVGKASLIDVASGSINDKTNLHSWGFSMLSWLANKIPGRYNALLYVASFFFLSFTLRGFMKIRRKCKISLCYLIIPLMLYFYNQSFNYMRQFCALGILFWGFCCFIRKEYVKYSISQVIAFTFHTSSVLFVVVPVLYLISHSNRYIRYFVLFCIIILAFLLNQYYYSLLSFMVSHGLVSDLYGDRYGLTGNYEGNTIEKTNILLFIAGYLVILYSKTKRVIPDKDFFFCFLLHTIYIALYMLTSLSVFLFRVSFYVYIVENIYIAIILSSKRTNLLIKSFYTICLIFYWVKYFILMNACETYPYKSSILGL